MRNTEPGRESSRSSDFNSLAADYATFRTSYSNELFDAILDYAQTPPAGRVLDLACGTGLGMLPYVRRGFTLTGIDVAPAMIEQARKVLPSAACIELITGRAESLPFPDTSFDLVSCAQAFHWFEPHAAFSECARVLRPGGALASFWKHAARSDAFTQVCEQIIRQWLGEDAVRSARDHAAEHESGWDLFWRYVAPTGAPRIGRPFADGEKRIMEFTLQRTADEFVGYQRSREKIRKVLGERRTEFLAELDHRLRAAGLAGAPLVQRQIQYLFLARKPT